MCNIPIIFLNAGCFMSLVFVLMFIAWKIFDLYLYFFERQKADLTDVKQHLKGLNFPPKIKQLLLLWQR